MTENVRNVHVNEYGKQPDVIICAPGRIHLIGEHSWFFDDKTLSMAIDLPVFVAISKRTDFSILVNFYQLKEHKKSNLLALKYRREDRWANIVKALIFAFQTMGYNTTGMNVTIYSDVPPSSGFGITTAVKVCCAIALKSLFNIPGDDDDIIDAIEIADKNFFNCETHLADVYTALFAKKNHCVLTNYATGGYKLLPFPFEEHKIILTDAKVQRYSLWQESDLNTEENKKLLAALKVRRKNEFVYEDSISEINEQLLGVPEEVRRRLLCVIRESQYLFDVTESLESKNISLFCKSIIKSHETLRDSFQISCPEIDWLVKRVQEFDAPNSSNLTSCARIVGKFFGRCTYSFLQEKNIEIYNQKLIDYERIFGFHAITRLVHSDDGAIIQNNLQNL